MQYEDDDDEDLANFTSVYGQFINKKSNDSMEDVDEEEEELDAIMSHQSANDSTLSATNTAKILQAQIARSKFALSNIPKDLPCREAEFNEIYDFLSINVQNRQGAILYVSGDTGTGKTATVSKVLRKMKQEFTSNKNSKFKLHTMLINAMKLSSPEEAFSKLHQLVFPAKDGSKPKAKQMIANLDTYFKTGASKKNTKDVYFVVVLDEADFLITKSQKEVYNLFNWPQNPSSRLCVIGISNTIRLDEKLLGSVGNRIQGTSCYFKTYNHEQLYTILKDRIKEHKDAIEDDALIYCAKQVALNYGDVRRALEICSRAAEIFEEEEETQMEKISIKHVQKAIQHIQVDSSVYPLRLLNQYHKLFLLCLVKEMIYLKSSEGVPFENVVSRVQTQLVKHNLAKLKLHDLTSTMHFLASMKIVTLKQDAKESFPLITSYGDAQDLEIELEADEELAPLFED